MRVLVDMNLSPRWIDFLAAAGFDSVHWSSVGACDAPDSMIVAYGAAHSCVVLTHDLDVGAILAATGGSNELYATDRRLDSRRTDEEESFEDVPVDAGRLCFLADSVSVRNLLTHGQE